MKRIARKLTALLLSALMVGSVVTAGTAPQQQKAADANCDGKVDINDATLIQKYLAKYIDRLG